MNLPQLSALRLGPVLIAALATVVLFVAQGLSPLSASSPAGIGSDEFNGSSLSSTWTVVDPRGDSTVTVGGGTVSISSPGSPTHDIWVNGVNAARIMQPVSNNDFQVESKFDSAVTQKYQLQGILVTDGANNFLRFGNYSTGSLTKAFVAAINPVTNDVTIYLNQSVPISATSYLRLDRTGDQWTFERSVDGTNWQTLTTINHSFNMTSIGVYAGNAAGASHTGVIDYFRDTLVPPGSAPTAVDDAYSVDEDAQLNVAAPGVLGNDTDPEGDPLSAVHVSDPTDGTVSLNSDGSFTYTPDPDFFGSDSFQYLAADATSQSLPATVTITVNGVNDPPVALDQSVDVSADTPKAITLTGSDPDNDSLTFAVATQPSNGTLTGTAPNLTYTPDPGHLGGDSFTFTASDASATSPAATVSINVTEVPTGFLPDEFGGSTLSPVWTFVNPVGDGSYSVGGGAVSITAPGGTSHDIWVNGVNAPRIMQSMTDIDFQAEVKFDSSVDLRYQLQGILLSDGNNNFLRFGNYSNGSQTKVFAAAINPVTSSVTIFANSTVEASSSAYMRLNRTGDDWTFERSVDGVNWQVFGPYNSSLTVTEIGVYSGNVGNPSHTAVVDYFRDTLTPPGSQPNAVDDAYSVDEDTTLNVAAPGVLGNDSDPEGDPLNALLVSGTANGSLTLNSDGSFTYTPDPNFFGSDAFSYRAVDATSQSVAANVDITVNPVDDPPVANPQTVDTGPGVAVAITLTGSDPDEDPLTFDVATQPTDGVLSGTAPNLTYTPDPGFEGADSFTFTVSDANNTSAPATVDINVADLGSGEIRFFYGNAQTFNTQGKPQVWVDVLGNATDPDGVSSVTYSLNGGPDQILMLGPDGRRLERLGDFVIQLPFDSLTLGPAGNQVTVTITDTLGSVTQASMTLTSPSTTVNTWPLSYTVDWSEVTHIPDAIQVIDGEWTIGPDGLTNAGTEGYDRLFAIGDIAWSDFTATVPFTVHDYDPQGLWCCGLGLFIRWQGHTTSPDACTLPGQPICGWEPYGNDAWYRFTRTGGRSDDAAVNPQSLVDDSGLVLRYGTPYVMKVEVETIGSDNVYRKKVWEQGDPEPDEWLVEMIRNPEHGGALTHGSLLFISHFTTVTFGDITIEPIPGS